MSTTNDPHGGRVIAFPSTPTPDADPFVIDAEPGDEAAEQS